VASFPDKVWCVQVHGRLADGDPTASADLCKAVLSPLVGWLYSKRRTTDRELIRDAATDALVDYIKHPERWKPERGTLISYICMAADRDLCNALEKIRRRRKHEVSREDVEDEGSDGNVSDEAPRDVSSIAKLLPMLEEKVKSETDRGLLTLMLQGERSTEQFASVLNIQNLPKKEKARIVKQHKDRLKKVIERLGKPNASC
jgi:RNA polymerase sigma-70 factor (ECF subfamily)